MLNCDKCGKVMSNAGAYSMHIKYCKLTKIIINSIVEDYTNHELSIRDIMSKYEICKTQFLPYLEGLTRSYSEANKLAHKKNPESYKHSEESKQLMREKRLKWMKENPEKTAWRKANMSYPEKVFKEKLEELGLDKKYLIIRERSVFPYFIDFAFENEKVAVEIDGSQHLLKERRKNDEKRDKYLVENGWKVYRVSASQVLNNRDFVVGDIINFIGESKSSKKCGLYVGKTLNQLESEELSETMKSERVENGGLTKSEKLGHYSQRKTTRPPHTQLLEEIKETNYVQVSKKYGVSDNGVRKWVRMYEKYGDGF